MVRMRGCRATGPTVTELGTGLGMLGLAAIDQAIGPARRHAQPLARDVAAPGAAARRVARYDAEFHAAWENGRAFLVCRRRPARAAAPGRRVEGHRAGAGRRGGADRPAGGPRLPRQLQVPLGHLVQRVTGRRVRPPVDRRPEPGRAGRGGRGGAGGRRLRKGSGCRAGATGTPRWRRPSTRRCMPRCGMRRNGARGGSGAAGRGHGPAMAARPGRVAAHRRCRGSEGSTGSRRRDVGVRAPGAWAGGRRTASADGAGDAAGAAAPSDRPHERATRRARPVAATRVAARG